MSLLTRLITAFVYGYTEKDRGQWCQNGRNKSSFTVVEGENREERERRLNQAVNEQTTPP